MRPHSLFSPIQSQTRHNLHQPKVSVQNFAPSSVRTTIGKSVKNVEIEHQVLSNGACEAVHSILIQRLPAIVTEKSLQRILVGSKDLISVKILPKQPEGSNLNSALVCFKNLNAAVEAKKVLDENLNLLNDSWTEVEILLIDPEYLSRLYALKYIPNIISPSSPLPVKVPEVSSLCQITQTNNHFHLPQRVSLTSTASARSESPSTRDEMLFQSHFFLQSPIGNHMTGQVGFNGKALINDTSMINNETDASLKTSILFVENGLSYEKEQRQLPVSTNPLHRTAGLSLNPVINTGSVQFSDYSSSDLISSKLSGSMMPKIPLKSRDLSITCQHGTLSGQHPKFPVINYSDHNPPCNTLYVGNLPNKTSEDELKTIFSKQRGYKRLCFRTKQNGPMCFVEFEDVSFATKALHELYGLPLHNSVKGGIRLSFSKNPLGVRSAQSRIISIPQNTSSSIAYKDGIFINTQKTRLGTTIGAPPGLVNPPGFGPTQFGFATAMSPMASVNGYHGIPAHADNDHRYYWTLSASHRMSAGRFPTIRYHEFSANIIGR